MNEKEKFILKELSDGEYVYALCKRMGMHEVPVRRLVRRLVLRGMLTKLNAGGSGRPVFFEASASGKKVIAAME